MAAMLRALAGHRESALARSIQRYRAMLVGDADDAEHGPEAHLGLRVLGVRRATSATCGPEFACPLGRPLAIVLVLERSVLSIGHRGARACVACADGKQHVRHCEAVNDARRSTHLDDLSTQLEGQAMQALIELNVVVDVGARLLRRGLEAQ